MSPQLFICTRFGLTVRDPAWFNHRLPLFSSITVPSLMAQRDQNFQWAIFVAPDLPLTVREPLEEMLAPFEGRAFVHSESTHTSVNVLALAEERGAVDADGYVFTARIDDDDAWSVRTVCEVHERTTAWLRNCGETPGMGLSFANGLEWIMYDMLDVDELQQKGLTVMRQPAVRPFSLSFHSMSVFVCARITEGISAISAGHPEMPDLLKNRGCAVDIVKTGRPMWLYCRHKQVQSSLQRSEADELDVTLADLEREFGIDRARTDHYLEAADEYGYGVIKRNDSLITDLEVELGRVRQQISNSVADDAQMARLMQEEAKLVGELTRVTENLVGDLKEPSSIDGES